MNSLSVIKDLFNCNRYLLGDKKRPTHRNKVNLHWWSYSSIENTELENVGDLLSPVIVCNMLKTRGIDFDTSIEGTKHLTAVGSALGVGVQKCTVWGSGCRQYGYDKRLALSDYDIRAVRGPKSREVLIQCGHICPEIYGDPAVLLPEFYSPIPSPEKHITYIPHFRESQATHDGVVTLSPLTKDWKAFINSLTQSELVLSSSLHGIILAESYGIPAIWVESKESSVVPLKYADWYESTGREVPVPAKNIYHALQIEPPVVPNLSSMRKELCDSFPFDLWD